VKAVSFCAKVVVARKAIDIVVKMSLNDFICENLETENTEKA